MVFIEPIDDGIFKSEGVTVKCVCGNFINLPESKYNSSSTLIIICPNCGRKI